MNLKNINIMIKEKFPDTCSLEQAKKIKKILGNPFREDDNITWFNLTFLFQILPHEITYDGHRGDLAVTPQDIAYFSIGEGWKHILVHHEDIPVGGNIYDAFIDMLKWLKENNLLK